MDCLKEDEINLERNIYSNTNRKVTNSDTFIPCPIITKGEKYMLIPPEK